MGLLRSNGIQGPFELDSPIAVFYFLFLFFTKIYFCFRNLQKYTPAAPLPDGRDLVAPLRGGRGFSAIISRNFLQKSPWRTAARQRGGRPPRPPGNGAAGSPILI